MNKESTVLVTFVVPVKDRSEYLYEALLSLQRQTNPNWECLVVDDNSKEDIQSVVKRLDDERISYTKNIHKQGVSGARNTGNELVKTEWIAVMDSDDINLPRRLEVSLAAIREDPKIDILYSNLYNFRDGTYRLEQWRYNEPYVRENLYDRDFIANNTAMYRKNKVIELGGYDESLMSAEDYDLWLKFADVHAVFKYIDEPLALYRWHTEQFAATFEGKEKMRVNAEQVIKRHISYL